MQQTALQLILDPACLQDHTINRLLPILERQHESTSFST